MIEWLIVTYLFWYVRSVETQYIFKTFQMFLFGKLILLIFF